MTNLEETRATYELAAEAFLDLVARLPLERYAGPGLGNWDLRALVGHAGRSFVTVATYLDDRADAVEIEDAADYFAVVSRIVHGSARDAIDQRGIEAGTALGEDPLAALRRSYDEARLALDLL